MKLNDKPSVTQMDRGGVYKMDRQKTAKNRNVTEIVQDLIIHSSNCPKKYRKLYPLQWHFHFLALFLSLHFIGISFIHFCDTWYVYPFHRHFLYLKW